MKYIWNKISELKVNSVVKSYLFLSMTTLVSVILGGLAWYLVGQYILSGVACFICFMGYPGFFFGYLGGIVYLYNHEFSDFTKDLQ